MWVPKEVVPRLQEEVEELLRKQLAMDELPDPDPGSRWDPNDLIIFHDFVLPVLQDKRETGFDSEEMIHKGFGFLVGLVPALLNRDRGTLEPSHFGKLAKLFHEFWLDQALERVRFATEEYYEENLPYLYRELRLLFLIRKGRGR